MNLNFLIPRPVLNELQNLELKASPQRSRKAKMIIERIKENFTVIEYDSNAYLDDLLIELALKNKYAVATIDGNLRKRLIKNDILTITMSNNRILIANSTVKK